MYTSDEPISPNKLDTDASGKPVLKEYVNYCYMVNARFDDNIVNRGQLCWLDPDGNYQSEFKLAADQDLIATGPGTDVYIADSGTGGIYSGVIPGQYVDTEGTKSFKSIVVRIKQFEPPVVRHYTDYKLADAGICV